jgi:hypothetical protein
MDPIPAIGLIASATQLIQMCMQTINYIHRLHWKQGEAGGSLLAIQQECTIIKAAVKFIEDWAKTPAAKIRAKQCSFLDAAMKGFLPSLIALQEEARASLVKGTRKDGSMSVGGRISFLWDEDKMNYHLSKVRNESRQLHFLVSTISL